MSHRRILDPAERSLWQKVVATVTPIHHARAPVREQVEVKSVAPIESMSEALSAQKVKAKPERTSAKIAPIAAPAAPASVVQSTLDSHWDRRFHKGAIEPELTIDLHGTGLSGAYQRLDRALEQAVHHHVRVILLITGKIRSHDRMSGQGRGAIASVVGDWLAASRHASHIAAVRNAHPRHGGAGAMYIILKRG